MGPYDELSRFEVWGLGLQGFRSSLGGFRRVGIECSGLRAPEGGILNVMLQVPKGFTVWGFGFFFSRGPFFSP